MHKEIWYKPGKIVYVNDKMQKHYSYKLTAEYGKFSNKEFKPYYTPKQMLKKGVFEGKYLNDCTKEFPQEWFEESKNKRTIIANPELNYFKIKSRLSLQQWKYNGWIPIINGDKDIRGWFQWYCRYFIGRRCETDHIQISRWKSFIRHRGQIDASIKRMPISKRPKTITEIKKHRPKQRQALLQWSHKCI